MWGLWSRHAAGRLFDRARRRLRTGRAGRERPRVVRQATAEPSGLPDDERAGSR
jgi:hypothetical protein